MSLTMMLQRWSNTVLVPMAVVISGIIVLLSMVSCGESQLTAAEHIQRAEAAQAEGRLNESIIELKNALQQEPQNAKARWLLGTIHVELVDGAAAEKELIRAHDLGVTPGGVAVPLAKALLFQGKQQELLDDILVQENFPTDLKAELHALRAKASLDLAVRKVGDKALLTKLFESDANVRTELLEGADAATREAWPLFVQADMEIQAALKAQADLPATWLGQAWFAYTLQRLDEARQWVDKVLQAQPEAIQALLLKSKIALQENDYAEAESLLSQVLKSHPHLLKPRLDLAVAQLSLEKLQEAGSHLDEVLKNMPNHVPANYYRAMVSYRQQDYERMLNHAEKVLLVAPDHHRGMLLAGTANYQLGSFEEARKRLHRFVSLVGNYEPALKLLAATQLELGMAQEAAAMLAQLEPQTADDASLFAAVGNAMMLGGDTDTGRSFLQKAVTAQPDQASLRAYLGMAALSSGDESAGVSDLEQALTLNPQLESAEYALFITHLRNREHQKALALAQDIQRKKPDSPTGWVYAGMAHKLLGQHAKAQESFNQALSITPGHPDASNNLALYALRAGDLDQARNIYENSLQHNPGHLQILMKLADVEKRAGRTERSFERLQEAIDINPTALQPRIVLGMGYIQNNEPYKALAITQQVLRDNAENPLLLSIVGSAQLQTKDLTGAVVTLGDLVRIEPKAASYMLLAKAHEQSGDIDSALAALRRALEIEPDHGNAKFTMATLLMQKGQLEDAQEHLADLKVVEPGNPFIAELEGKIALKQNRTDDAIELFRMALDKRSNNLLLIQLAQAQYRGDDVEGALSTLQGWLDENPQDTTVRFILAETLASLGRLDESKHEYLETEKLKPDDPDVQNNLARVLLRSGAAAEALSRAQRADELAPDQPRIMRTLGMALLETGRPEEALIPLTKAARGLPDDPGVQYYQAQAAARSGDTAQARRVLRELLTTDSDFPERDKATALLKELGG